MDQSEDWHQSVSVLKASVVLSRMEVQMRRDVSEQKTSHTNKWLGKQRRAGGKSQEEQSSWEEESLAYLDVQNT